MNYVSLYESLGVVHNKTSVETGTNLWLPTADVITTELTCSTLSAEALMIHVMISETIVVILIYSVVLVNQN